MPGRLETERYRAGRPARLLATIDLYPQVGRGNRGQELKMRWRRVDMKLFTRSMVLRAAGFLLALVPSLLPHEALAARIENPVAVFSGLDKITGRITTFDVYVNETVQFGALQVTPKACYSRDQAEAQKID